MRIFKLHSAVLTTSLFAISMLAFADTSSPTIVMDPSSDISKESLNQSPKESLQSAKEGERAETPPIKHAKTSATNSASRKQNSSRRLSSRFPSVEPFQLSQSIFFQANIGVGFLYFAGLEGNLMGRPVENFNPAFSFRDAPLKGRLSYNRTPLFEYVLGYQFKNWLKAALSYQHQGGVVVQTKVTYPFPPATQSRTDRIQFTSNLSLDAILAKVYFELPWAMLCKQVATSPYIAVGIGPGWQSWTNIQANYIRGNSGTAGSILPFRQKISANAVWMVDTGFRMQSTSKASPFSVVLGCKYNQWGQARSMGKITQQGEYKVGLGKPVKIKTVYQFSPYLGAQWNFAPDCGASGANKLKGKSPSSRRPFWVPSRDFQAKRNIWTQFNVSPGFLYFSGLEGNLMGAPSAAFIPATRFRNIPIEGKLSYNRTPLFEYLLGYRFNSWLKVALSYQYQGNINVQSQTLFAFPLTGPGSSYAKFRSNLSLHGTMVKAYYELPYSLIWRALSMNAYLAVGVGPGWQSWTNTNVNYMDAVIGASYTGNPLPLRQKSFTNAVWMVDVGFRTQSAYPNSLFTVLMGCKYNQWGQARRMGQMSQQGTYKYALSEPVSIKTVYQFAPYLGVEWNFSPDTSAGASYKLKCKRPQTWMPYWVSSQDFQKQKGLWTQFNVGVGFVYFAKRSGNLMGRPVGDFLPTTQNRDVPLKGRESYNRGPLFDYLLGYKVRSWLNVALSYQYQGGIDYATRVLPTNPSQGIPGTYAQLTSSVSFNAIVAKVYYELPYSMIWRSLSTNPYLAVGIGPGWQTWTRNEVNYMRNSTVGTGYQGEILPLRMKVSGNAFWMLDAGLRIQSAYPNSKFFVLLGCKYNYWGQARGIGNMREQGVLKKSLVSPLRYEVVYQFAPYLGVQWAF